MKAAVLRCLELCPEAYRQKLQRLKKNPYQTYVELARDKETLFDRWCTSSDVKDFGKLKQLMLLEQFKNCLPDRVATYLNEHKVCEISKAAVLVDEYVLRTKQFLEIAHFTVNLLSL